MDRIEVVAKATVGSPLPGGFGRRAFFDTQNVRVGETRIGQGAVSAWHHHGGRTLYGFVVAGELALEFGPGGRESVRPTAGEFFRIPPGLVHRDVNPTHEEAIIVHLMVGEGPATIDVTGPEP